MKTERKHKNRKNIPCENVLIGTCRFPIVHSNDNVAHYVYIKPNEAKNAPSPFLLE